MSVNLIVLQALVIEMMPITGVNVITKWFVVKLYIAKKQTNDAEFYIRH